MLSFLKNLFTKKPLQTKGPLFTGKNRIYMSSDEIPATAEEFGYYNCGFIETPEGQQGWALMPINKYTPGKFKV